AREHSPSERSMLSTATAMGHRATTSSAAAAPSHVNGTATPRERPGCSGSSPLVPDASQTGRARSTTETTGGHADGCDAQAQDEGPGPTGLVRRVPATRVRTLPGLPGRRIRMATGLPRADRGSALDGVRGPSCLLFEVVVRGSSGERAVT